MGEARAAARWRIPLVDLRAEYAEVGAAVEEAALRVLRSGRYVLGPETRAFEAELAARVGAGFAIGVGSGTDALALSLRALGVGPGDEVVTTPFTFFATVGAVLLCGAEPVFADVEPGGFHLDPAAVEAALTPRTRAVVPVHLFGRCADLCALRERTGPRGIPILEDACQALGASRAGVAAGVGGAAGCFSFYPSKPLGAAGDAGCVVTDDPELAERLRSLRSHGVGEGGYRHLGTTARLDELQAAVLRAKLPLQKAWRDRRERNQALYRRALAGVEGLALPAVGADEAPVWSHFVVRCRDRDRVRKALGAAGIESRVYYPRPAHREPLLADLAGRAGRSLRPAACPEADRACREALALPVRPSLTPDEVREVAQIVAASLGSAS